MDWLEEAIKILGFHPKKKSCFAFLCYLKKKRLTFQKIQFFFENFKNNLIIAKPENILLYTLHRRI
jgi:hypothetical protein